MKNRQTYGDSLASVTFVFLVYQKNLPVQKYVQHKCQEFMMATSLEASDETWGKHFEQLKEELVKKENFQIIQE